MRTTFELNGLIIDIGNKASLTDLDTTGMLGSNSAEPGRIGFSIYQRDLVEHKTIRYVCGAYLKSHDAVTIGTALIARDESRTLREDGARRKRAI